MVAADVQKTVDDKFMSALTAEVNKIGQTRFLRFKNEVFSAAFVDHAKALDAVKVGLMKVCSEICSKQRSLYTGHGTYTGATDPPITNFASGLRSRTHRPPEASRLESVA